MKVIDVFISYRRSDGSGLAAGLKNYLESKGIRAFYDKDDLEVGRNFPDKIRNAIRIAPHYVLIGTPDAFKFRAENKETGDLDFVHEEMRTALEAFRSSGEHTVTVLFSGHNVPKRDELPEDIRDLLNQNNVLDADACREAAYNEILKIATKVTRINLWHAAHRKLETSKRPGGRFARLHVDKSIMPGAERKIRRADFPIEVKTDKENAKVTPLLDVVGNTKGHLYLIGEGGIGKTTSLIKIMENAYEKEYSEDSQIPIFVELSFAPDRNGKWIESKRSTFIYRSVYKQILDRRAADQDVQDAEDGLDEVFSMDPAVAVNPVKGLFTKESPAPEYLLLLDGLNEVSRAKISGGSGETVAELIFGEIRYITENCPNVRVILTSRSDETAPTLNNFTRVYLTGVDDDHIESYLKSSDLPADRIKAALGNKELMKTLRVPLFLTVYATLKNTDGILTQGEILHEFFHERGEDLYTTQDRLARIGTNFSASESSVEQPYLTADMKIFVLELILPEIGYEMQSAQAFYFKPVKLYKPILKILNGRDDTDECGRYGSRVFTVKGRLDEKKPKAIAKSILDVFDDEDDAADAIIDCLVKELGIFQVTGGEYGFIHQHFRDYFSAVKHINAMRLAVYLHENGESAGALELVSRFFKEEPVDYQIRRFIGEITGEHHNKPYCENKTWKLPQNDSLMMKTLEIYRGVDHKDAGYAVYSLVHTLNEARGELSGCDFSRLDFTECNLNGMRLSRKNLHASFIGAVLHGKNLKYEGHTARINSICYSPDGKRILTSSDDETVKIWDSATLQVIGTLEGHMSCVNSASYSPDGKRIVTASDDKTAKVWDTESFDLLATLEGHTWEMKSASYSPECRRIVTTSVDETAKVWDAESFELLGMVHGYNPASYSPDGKRIVTEAAYYTQIHNSENIELLAMLEGHKSFVNSSSYSPDGKRIVTASDDKTAKVWDAESVDLLGTLEGHTERVFSASYSPDGKRIVTASADGTAKVWNAENFELLGTLEGHRNRVKTSSFSPDGTRIVTVSDDGTTKIWGAESFELIGTLEGELASYSPDGRRIVTAMRASIRIYETKKYSLVEKTDGAYIGINSADFSPDGRRIVTASKDKTAKVWDAENFELLGTLEGHTKRVESASSSPDSKRIVTASWDGTAKVWDAESFELLGTLERNKYPVNSASYNPNGKRIVTASWDGTAKVWDAENFELLGMLEGHKDWVDSASYSPDGKRIVTASEDNTAKVWDVESFELLGTLEGHTSSVWSTSYSPDGKRIVTTSYDRTARVWNAESFEPLGTLEGYEWPVNSVSYSPDGKRIVTASLDSTAKVWDADSFELLGTLEGHTRWVESARYNSDGTLIITASIDGTAKIWDAETFECIETIRNVPGMNFVGVDFTALDPRSELDKEDKKLIRLYGGKI